MSYFTYIVITDIAEFICTMLFSFPSWLICISSVIFSYCLLDKLQNILFCSVFSSNNLLVIHICAILLEATLEIIACICELFHCTENYYLAISP